MENPNKGELKGEKKKAIGCGQVQGIQWKIPIKGN
jgi:hypothetical protein